MKKKLKNLVSFLANSLIFLIPTQLALHFWPQYSFVFGIRVDYLSPAIYFTDLLVVAILLLWREEDRPGVFWSLVKYKYFFVVLFSLTIFNTFFSTSFYVSLYKWVKIIAFSFLSIYFAGNLFQKRNLFNLRLLFLSASASSLVGILQFFRGATIGGILTWFGERGFSLSTPGIALFAISGREYLRAYSTFPHPNSFAGYLGVVLVLLFFWGKPLFSKRAFYLIAILLSLAFVLTFSISAIASLLFVVLLSLVFTKEFVDKLVKALFMFVVLLSLLSPIVFSKMGTLSFYLGQKYTERIGLGILAGKMISDRFFLGQGINTFTLDSPRFQTTTSYFWLLQPVHNLFLLTFAETGVIGLSLVFLGLSKVLANLRLGETKMFACIFLFVLLTGFVDHYWLTLQQNMLLLSFIAGLDLSTLKFREV